MTYSVRSSVYVPHGPHLGDELAERKTAQRNDELRLDRLYLGSKEETFRACVARETTLYVLTKKGIYSLDLSGAGLTPISAER